MKKNKVHLPKLKRQKNLSPRKHQINRIAKILGSDQESAKSFCKTVEDAFPSKKIPLAFMAEVLHRHSELRLDPENLIVWLRQEFYFTHTDGEGSHDVSMGNPKTDGIKKQFGDWESD